MQAIRTRYYGPTNNTGSCIRAKCAAGSIRFAYDYALNTADNHAHAAKALVNKLGWNKDAGYMPWAGGCDAAGDWVWVNTGRYSPTFGA